jgi:exosortase A
MSATTATARTRPTTLPVLLTLGVGVAATLAIFWPECQAAVHVWMESTAYGHCFLVLPITLYLLWDRRDSLRGLVPRPTLFFAILAVPLSLGWLAAERLGIMEGRQLAAVAILQVFFLTVFGWRMYRALSGPLLYLFFLVPFGLFLTPALQNFTAWFVDVGLSVLGIPHYITDMTIEISAGTFYVAEACAGLRFLIASVAFGVFFALLNYNSPGRRIGFVVASSIVPIIANGFRALGIVVLGNILGSAQAAAADHLVYGWFFFSFVTLMLVLAGLPFRQSPPPAVPDDDAVSQISVPMLARAALVILALAAIGPGAALALDRSTAGARLAGSIILTAPEGCRIDPLAQPAPDRLATVLTCGQRDWSITIQAVPGRSTGAALAEARRNLVGPIESEEITVGPLHGAAGWQQTVSNAPGVIVGTTGWVDGQPAPGGLRQRLIQARDSILGASHDGVVMAVSWRPDRPISDSQAALAESELAHFIAAQPDLNGMIAAASAHPNQ